MASRVTILQLLRFSHRTSKNIGSLYISAPLWWYASSFLLSTTRRHVPSCSSQSYAIKTKDFIPPGHVDWFKNPILAPDAFEEGNMANISPTIKVDNFVVPGRVEHIFLGASSSAEDIVQYKALFQKFRDIFTWTYT